MERGGLRAWMRSTMSARGVGRDTVPSRKGNYLPPVCRVSMCMQHVRDSAEAVRRGQNDIVPSSLEEERDCRSPWLASPRDNRLQSEKHHEIRLLQLQSIW